MNASSLPIFAPRVDASEPVLFRWLGRLVDVVTTTGVVLSGLSVLACLALITYSVVMRYAFNAAPTWVDDSVGFLIFALVAFGAPLTLREGGHITVDMVTGRFGERGQRWVSLWSTFAAAGVALIFIVNGLEVARFSKELGLMTNGNVEIPIHWLQMLLPLCGAMMLLVCLESLLRAAMHMPSLARHGHGPHAATKPLPAEDAR